MEHDGVKMLKINLALNFFGKIFGNKLILQPIFLCIINYKRETLWKENYR